MDAATLRAWATEAARALAAARAPIDRLNVFPVPDGDTGSNLALSVAEGAEQVRAAGADLAADGAEVAMLFARGTLLGARGNSGVIVSQYLHGFAEGLAEAADDGRGPTAGAVVARALERAERAARTAVLRPVEGTILTAATAAAAAARTAADHGGGPDVVVHAAVAGAREALARSPETLDVLRAAGVVDAGASGLVVLLEALATALGHPAAPAPGDVSSAGPTPPSTAVTAHAGGRPVVHRADDGEFEVMYVVERGGAAARADDLAPGLSRRLEAIGASVAVVGGADGWHVHVHTDRPDAAIAAGDVGRRSQVVVRRLAPPPAAPVGPGVVVGTGAPGLVADLARTGAVVLVHTGRTVTARALLRAVVDTGAADVVVLPGSPAAGAAARDAARTASARVRVLDADEDLRVVVALAAAAGSGWSGDLDPTRPPSCPDPSASAAGHAAAMREALAAVRTATVDLPDVDQVLAATRRLLADGGELVTVLSGAAMSRQLAVPALRDALSRGLATTHPEVEVVVLPGGQSEPVVALAVQ